MPDESDTIVRAGEVVDMACGNCGGYYSCHCDLLKMQEELRIKKMEVELLEFKVAARKKEVESSGTRR
jgi:hypothetical protein